MNVNDEDMLVELRAARREHDRLAAEIRAWMSAEAKEGHLRSNGQAPMWSAYERALERVNLAANALAEGADDAPQPGGGS